MANKKTKRISQAKLDELQRSDRKPTIGALTNGQAVHFTRPQPPLLALIRRMIVERVAPNSKNS